MVKINFLEGIWRGTFISIGILGLFSILFTTTNYNIDRNTLLLTMLSLVYIGIFFNLTIKRLLIAIIQVTFFLLIYLYFFANKFELVKYYEVIFPIICVGLVNLGYLKLKKE